MFCTKCGAEYKVNAKFCTGCGNEIVHTSEVFPSQVAPVQNEKKQQFQKRSIGYWLVPVSIFLVGICGVVAYIFYQNNDEEQLVASNTPETQAIKENPDSQNTADEVPDEKTIVAITKTYLNILYQLYWITQENEVEPESTTALLMSMVGEAIKDKKDLEGLSYQVSQLSQSKSQAISTTGLVLEVSIQELIKAYTDWISYLRTVSEDNIEMSEFQYQFMNFNASTKKTFMSLYENTSLYPYVFINLEAEGEDDNTWNISDGSKKEILGEIDRLFADVFVRDEKSYAETETRNVIVLIVKNLRGFFAPEDKDPFGNSVQ